MDGQKCGKERAWDDSLEADFRAKLLRAKTEGRSKKETAKELGAHPFLLGLVIDVMKKDYLTERYPVAVRNDGRKNGAHAGIEKPSAAPTTKDNKDQKNSDIQPWLVPDWQEFLRKNPDLRDEWRCETLVRVGQALATGTMLETSDPEHPHLGGRFRRLCEFKAIKAQWQIWKERTFRVKKGETSEEDVTVRCRGGHLKAMLAAAQPSSGPRSCCPLAPEHPSYERWWREASKDQAREEERENARIDLAMMIDSLEDPRQRAVMQLRAVDYDKRKIAAVLGLTYDQVRTAEKNAKQVLRKRFRRVA